MLGKITGKVEDGGKGLIIATSSGGVGYLINVPKDTKNGSLGKEETFYTHTVLRKDTIELFGFLSQEEYSVFLLLISVSGIGPKKALSFLETAPSNTLIEAIKKEDVELLETFGISKKQGQKIILDLSKKVEGSDSGISQDIYISMIALGYTKKEIRDALGGITLKGATRDEQIKEALKIMIK